jgi:hypothetical protein
MTTFLAPEDFQRQVASVVRLEGQPLGVEIGPDVAVEMHRNKNLVAWWWKKKNNAQSHSYWSDGQAAGTLGDSELLHWHHHHI